MVNVSVDIARPRSEVFDLMADARNEPKWNNKVSETELESGEPIGESTRFSTVNRGQPYLAMITTYKPPDELVFDVDGKAMTIIGRLRFTEAGDGTRLDAEFDMRPKGAMKVMLPLMSPAVRKDFPRQLASFKQFCESRSEPTA